MVASLVLLDDFMAVRAEAQVLITCPLIELVVCDVYVKRRSVAIPTLRAHSVRKVITHFSRLNARPERTNPA